MKIVIRKIQYINEIEVVINCADENKEVNKIVSALNSIYTKIQGRGENELFQIDVNEILYIESVDRKTFVYSETAVYETEKRIYELEEFLKHCSFFRASKSTIVNLKRVKSLRPEIGVRLLLTMDNDEKIIVSRQYSSIIKQTLGVN